MAINYTLLTQSKELTSEMLMHQLRNIGMMCDEPIILEKGIEINQFQNTIGLTIYLIDSGNPPYDAYDFDLLSKEFKYLKSLSFRLNKDFEDSEIQWKAMITIVFSLMNQVTTNAIFAFETDILYCLFTEKHELFINSQTGIKEKPYFQEYSNGWKCNDITNSIIDF